MSGSKHSVLDSQSSATYRIPLFPDCSFFAGAPHFGQWILVVIVVASTVAATAVIAAGIVAAGVVVAANVVI